MIKISFPSNDFSRALSVLGKQIARKSLLPILSDVLLRIDSERQVFQMIASDSEAWLTLDLPFINLLEIDKEPFVSAVLPFATLKEVFSSLPSVPCTAWIDGLKFTVSHADGKFSVPVQEGTEFPLPPAVVTQDAPMPRSVSPVCRFTVDSQWLLKSIGDARNCVDNNELRPQMNAECLDVFADHLVIASSNGYTLYKNQLFMGAGSDFLEYREFAADKSARLLLPRTVLGTIVTAFAKAEKVTVTADEQRIQFQTEGIDLVCRCTEGNYPNYESVIPKDNPYTVTVSRDSLSASIRRLGIFASEDTSMVLLHRYEDKLVLEADDADFSTEGNEQVSILNETKMPQKKTFGFKIPTLRALLDIIGTQNVEIHLSSPSGAALLKEEDANSQLTLLIMPMLVQ